VPATGRAIHGVRRTSLDSVRVQPAYHFDVPATGRAIHGVRRTSLDSVRVQPAYHFDVPATGRAIHGSLGAALSSVAVHPFDNLEVPVLAGAVHGGRRASLVAVLFHHIKLCLCEPARKGLVAWQLSKLRLREPTHHVEVATFCSHVHRAMRASAVF